MNKQTFSKTAKDLAWEMFKETGNAGYYLLYHDLKNE